MLDSNNNNTESPEVLPEKQASQLKVKDFAARSKAKAKPRRRELVDYSPSIIPMNERKWIDIEPRNSSLSAYEVSKESNQSSSTLSNNTTRRRRSSSILEDEELSSESISTCTVLVGRSLESMLGSRRRSKKKRYQYCTDDSRTIVYFRTLQGHSGRNLIDPTLQDNVIIQSNFLQCIYHVGCAFNLHSIISSGLIFVGQSLSKKTDSILSPCGSYGQQPQGS